MIANNTDVLPHNAMDSRHRVLIIGAECTGLALGQGLKKAGIPVTVSERRDEDDILHGRDWNIGTTGVSQISSNSFQPICSRS